jgi:hypothetical protein
MKSAVGTSSGLSFWSRTSETWVLAAIEASVSPARTRYVLGPACFAGLCGAARPG